MKILAPHTRMAIMQYESIARKIRRLRIAEESLGELASKIPDKDMREYIDITNKIDEMR